MSLKIFHIVFITLSALLSIGCGLLSFKVYFQGGGGVGYIAIGIGSLLAGGLLTYYGDKFLKKMKGLKLILLLGMGLFLLSSNVTYACSICTRNIEGLIAHAMNWGILTLMFCIVSLLIGFAVFFIYLVKKNKEALSCQ